MSLFREQAVRQYMDPDARGGVLRVAPPSGARVFAVLALLFVVACWMAVTRTVSVTARGRGIVRPAVGIQIVRSPIAGEVVAVGVTNGGDVDEGETLLVIQSEELDPWRNVMAPLGGRIDALAVNVGDWVPAGKALAKIVPIDGPTVALLAIGAEHRAQLAIGRKVRLSLDEHPSEEAGFGLATIVRISADPLSEEVTDPLLAQLIEREPGPHYLIELAPDAMPPRAVGNYRNGMIFTGEVVLRQQRIVTLLFPPLERILGDG